MLAKLADYHIHTSFCNHASGTMKAYVERAIKMGLQEIGFADHNPFPDKYDSHYRMRPADIEIYFNVIYDLQQQFPEIIIKTGIELDYLIVAIDYLKDFLSRYKFDYVIGSVHYLKEDNISNLQYIGDLQTEDIQLSYQKYFSQLENAISSGLFDIIAHFDLPKRFWGKMASEALTLAENALKKMKACDVCLEVNTSGFRINTLQESFPSPELLEVAYNLNIPLTLGSDAHTPQDVGSCFEKSIELIKHIGYKEIYFFENRVRNGVKI